MWTSTASAPALARSTNSAAITSTSIEHDVLEPGRVRRLEREEAGHERDRPGAEVRDEAEREARQDDRERDREPGGQLAARDRAQPLHRMLAVVGRVADVVREVRRARGRAVRDEGHAGVEPQARVPDLAREQQAREQEKVLRPLAGAQRDERGAPDRARCGDGGHGHRPDGRRLPAAAESVARRWAPRGGLRANSGGGITGRRRSNRLPVPELALELDATAERDRQLAGDRQASPVPPPSRDQNGRKMRSRSDGLIPGPVSATETETAPFAAASASSTRPPSGVHRKALESRLETIWSTRSPSETITGAAVAVAAVVDLAPPRLLAEGGVRLVDQAAHVHLLVQDREPVRVELGEVEHVADEALEALRLRGDDPERLRLRHGSIDQPFPESLDMAADRGQRRPQLVRDGHQEVPLLLLCLGEPGGHLTEAFGRWLISSVPGTSGTSTSYLPWRSRRPPSRARARASRSGATGTRRARRRRTVRPRARPGAARRARTSPGSGRSSSGDDQRAEVLPLERERLADGEERLVLARRSELEGGHLLAVDQRLPLVSRPAERTARAGRSRAGRTPARRRSRDARRSPSRARARRSREPSDPRRSS